MTHWSINALTKKTCSDFLGLGYTLHSIQFNRIQSQENLMNSNRKECYFYVFLMDIDTESIKRPGIPNLLVIFFSCWDSSVISIPIIYFIVIFNSFLQFPFHSTSCPIFWVLKIQWCKKLIWIIIQWDMCRPAVQAPIYFTWHSFYFLCVNGHYIFINRQTLPKHNLIAFNDEIIITIISTVVIFPSNFCVDSCFREYF